ncbi:Zinc finger MYM-type protein 1-like [Oopsacas minuta]|uniref:Zinc finger MYM-type protein 1-like n=1 Tax=Oopsacas minuta TaxID=111878 RepID=A0AAV7KF05_9METZ|nr:Zinc finger MYM-type protein 1-like [Oopsacas minuta]
MKDMILEQIKQELHEAEYFTIIADESKETRKKEQVVVALRYCYPNIIHEEFIGIAEAQSLDADGFSDTIIRKLRRVYANMENCVGQGHDGASVVSGHFKGVQKKIPEKTAGE